MFCDRCKKEDSYFNLNCVEWNDKNRHYWVSTHNRIRPMKALLCDKCVDEAKNAM